MVKRKQVANDDDDGGGGGANSDDSSSDVSLIDVDFDFFDPNPSIDYLALKRLIAQLFQRDADLVYPHDLAELVLAQPRLGTTVKTDGMESDPYAFLTVLNMHVHHEHPSIKAIANYCLEKAAPRDQAFHTTLQALFSQTQHHVGFVFCERLINMPVQVIPHMYRMLVDELKRAISEGEQYTFSHLLFISRTYHLTPDEESAIFNAAPRTNGQAARKPKRSRQPSEPEPEPPADHIYSFHHEDEYIKKVSLHSLDYTFTTASPEPREKDAFGVENRGRMMLVPAERFLELVATMGEVYAVR